jgi:ankyrin repeat protein
MASVADISAPYGITALSMAILHNQIEVSEFLISQGASQHIPSQDWTMLDVFDYYLHASRIDYDISASATLKDHVQFSGIHWHWNSFRAYENLNMLRCYEFSRLHNAVLGISREAVQKAAVACKSTIDEPDLYGRTPLHWATLIGEESIIRTLLYYGADPTKGDMNGASPLHLTIAADSLPCVRILLDGGGNIEQLDRFGSAPIHWASHIGAVSSLGRLLECGADINSRSSIGEPPLYFANRGLQLEVVKCLITCGASTNIVDK